MQQVYYIFIRHSYAALKGRHLPAEFAVNPLFKHPSKGWLVVRQQDETKSYCICSLYDHQPRTDIKTYILDYVEIEG